MGVNDMRDLVVKADWFKGFQKMPENIKKEIFYRIIKLGCFEEEIDTTEDSWEIESIWSNIEGNIIRMKKSKEDSEKYGKNHGRKPMANEDKIYEYLQKNPKAKVKEIGAALGLDKGNSSKGDYAYIYDMKVWRERKNIKEGFSYEDFLDGNKNSGNRILFSEKNSENPNSESKEEQILKLHNF